MNLEISEVKYMNILFLQTGGTIDKDYPQGEDNHGYGFEIGEPAFVPILKRAKVSWGLIHRPLMKKDSLDMTDVDRAFIFEIVTNAHDTRIVITHGTDTIRDTAEALSTIKGKTVVLTGAMLPEKFKNSDADFNLGMAVCAAQHFLPGVYIALNGEVVHWNLFELT